MACKLVKLSMYSGNKASIYSVVLNDESQNLFDKFVAENGISFLSEIQNIAKRLQVIGQQTGARISFFKLHEGSKGDGVCALFDIPKSCLRLYCIRYGTQIVILGGGGPKAKDVRALQDNEKLKKENYFLRKLSKEITKRIIEGEIEFVNDHRDFSGDLNFDDDE